MASTIRIKRRWVGSPGAPASLASGELAYNGLDNILYLGYGDDGAGNATSVVPIAGSGWLAGYAPLNSPAFTGTPTAPTAAFGTNTTQLATTAFVQAAISAASIPDGDKGDITVSGSGATWTIDANVVTNAKLAPMPANTFKGNNTGSSGGPMDLTVAQTRTALSINNVDNTADVDKPVSTAQAAAIALMIPLTQKGAANGVATLGADSKIPVSQLPATAISDTFVVANQAAMLALSAQVGDVAVRTDLNKSFILRAEPAGTLANWQELLTPTDVVQSVFGRTGVVVAQTGDYTVAQVTGAAPLASPTFTGVPAGPTAAAGTNTTQLATTAFVMAGLNLKANIASPTFTGTPAGPTAAAGTNTTQLATTAFVTAATTTATGLALLKAQNLNDLPNKPLARTNLGLGTMATQDASAVAITGGTIDNVVLDGGTF